MNREIVCIGCPMGCRITVEADGARIIRVQGNGCPRGDAYARQECAAPMRIVTGSVPVHAGSVPVRAKNIPGRPVSPMRVSVKTSEPVPKQRMFDVMAAIRAYTAEAPVRIGDVLIPRVAGTDADLIASGNA